MVSAQNYPLATQVWQNLKTRRNYSAKGCFSDKNDGTKGRNLTVNSKKEK